MDYRETIRRLDEVSDGLKITADAHRNDQKMGRGGNTMEEWNAIGQIDRASEYAYSAARWLERVNAPKFVG